MLRFRLFALQLSCLLLCLAFIDATLAQRPIYGASWGSNLSGRLGIGQNNARKAGTMMSTNAASAERPTADLNIKRIVSGSDFAIAVTASNEILTWGSNSQCQLNRGSCFTGGASINEPAWMNALPIGDPYFAVSDVMVAGATAYALIQTSSSNILYSWGSVANKAGTVSMMPQYSLSAGPLVGPSAVGPLNQPIWTDVLGTACSGSLCFARTGHGMYGWGDGYASPVVFPCASPTDGVCDFGAQIGFSSLLGGASVIDACVATETDTVGTKTGARMVLMTDDNRLLLAGTGMQCGPASDVGWTGVSGSSLHATCGAVGISEVRCSNAAVLVRCGNTVLSFGKNDQEVLGNAGSTPYSYASPFVVPLPALAGGQDLYRMAAGRNSVFLVTTQGRDLIGWGSADDCGMAANCSPQAWSPSFVNLNGAVFKGSQYYPIDVTATAESTGGFIRLAPGPIGACPSVPSTMLQQFYCDTGNVYTFLSALVFSGTYNMPPNLALQGNMTLLGDTLMEAPHALSLTGSMRARGHAAAIFSGAFQVNGGSVFLEQDSLLQLDAGASLNLNNGAIELATDSTLLITASNFEAVQKRTAHDQTATVPIISVNGPVTLDGNVTIVVPEAIVLQLLQLGQNGLVPNASMSANTVAASTFTKTITTTVVLLQPTYNSCQKPQGHTTHPTPTTLFTVITLDSSDCSSTPPPPPPPPPPSSLPPPSSSPSPPINPAVPSTIPISTPSSAPSSAPSSNAQSESNKVPNKKMSTTTLYIIIFSIVGACIIAAVIAGIVILKCDTVKRIVLPYREH